MIFVRGLGPPPIQRSLSYWNALPLHGVLNNLEVTLEIKIVAGKRWGEAGARGSMDVPGQKQGFKCKIG